MRLAFPLVCTLILTLAGCGTSPVKAPVTDQSLRPHTTATHHVVSAGETLYSIAWQYGLDFRELARVNAIRAPYLIRVGQRLALREPSARSGTGKRASDGKTKPAAAAGSAPKPAPGKREAASVATAASVKATRVKAEKPVSKAVGKDRQSRAGGVRYDPRAWRWPASGRLKTSGWARQGGRKGIQILGRRGQPVFAANAGRVVYSGSGLRGYGRLIIIKHNNTYLSAYGHNAWLMVKQGDHVAAGQQIATMGSRYGTEPALYFEVRKNGKPINPLAVLPKRRP